MKKIKREIKKNLDANINGNILNFVRCNKSSSKREVHSDKCLPQETEKVSNKQPNFMSQITGKRTNEVQS